MLFQTYDHFPQWSWHCFPMLDVGEALQSSRRRKSILRRQESISMWRLCANMMMDLICNNTSFLLSLPLWKEIHGFSSLQKDFKSFYAFLRMGGKKLWKIILKCKMLNPGMKICWPMVCQTTTKSALPRSSQKPSPTPIWSCTTPRGSKVQQSKCIAVCQWNHFHFRW